MAESRKELEFVQSSKGKDLAVYDNYVFKLNYIRKDTRYFECHKNKASCKARLILYADGSYATKNEHNHPPNREQVECYKLRKSAKEMVTENPTMPPQEVLEKVESMVLDDPSVAIAMGASSNMKRIIRQARRTVTGEMALGTNREEVIIPDMFKVTQSGKKFLFKDIPGKERMIIFASEDSLQKLAMCQTWMVDGTFKSCPALFSQLYTIHGVFMNDVVPFVYAFMPSKTEAAYTTLLESVQAAACGEPMDPSFIVMDFELAMINACREVFPTAKLYGCLFHLGQSIYRHVCTSGFKVKYAEDKEFCAAVRALQALAFVPLGDVIPRYFEIRSWYKVNTNEPLKKIYKYFADTYIGTDWGDVLFPTAFWNCYNRFQEVVPRTNNALEGWHFRINSKLLGSHQTMWKCLNMLVKEHDYWELQCSKLSSGLVEQQKKKYRKINERLGLTLATYNTTSVTIINYLASVSAVLQSNFK